MNHIPTHILSSDARPLTRRALAKLRTRNIVLEAAKKLFTERGYGPATVRDIATAAGMSTGAVFANFTDKADLFNEVIVADYEALAQRMRQTADHHDQVDGGLLAVLSAGYEFHLAQLPLLQAVISESWSHGADAETRVREGLHENLAIVEGLLRRAVDHGQLDKGMDVALVADMIWQGYMANFRLAVFDGWELPQLRERLARQIAVILAGFRT
jgi:TetR/AcrR family transcriptional regulator, transcriptional repressor of aconitase